MNVIERSKKILGLGLSISLLVGAGALLNGCAYAGVATTPDGTVIIARNDYLLFGLLRKVYSCKSTDGRQLTCVEVTAP